MPELPEVETMVRGIRPVVEGREIRHLRRCRCRYKPLAMMPSFRRLKQRTVGRTVTTVTRRGKRIVFELSGGDALVIEPRMTGLLLLADPPDREHLRLEWQFAGETRSNSLWFWDRRGLGTVSLYNPQETVEALGPENLGPDALDMSERNWRDRCGRTSRPVKVALLDQRWVAGIGNLYANEILHHAGIHPARRTDELAPPQIRRLHAAVQDVLPRAILYEGSTLNDGTYRNVLSRNGRYQYHHRVYNRADETCATCGRAPVQRVVQAQRSTFFCGVCQPLQ